MIRSSQSVTRLPVGNVQTTRALVALTSPTPTRSPPPTPPFIMYTSVLSLALIAASAQLTAAAAEDITAVCVLAGDAGVSGRATRLSE